MKQNEKQILFNKLKELIIQCNKILVNNFRKINRSEVFYKNHFETYTSFDLEINKICFDFLIDAFPDSIFISEETFKTHKNFNYFKEKDLVFIIDPIDGTTNFVNGFELCCISIGIMSKGKFIGGIISAPLINRIVCGIEDFGCFGINLNGEIIHEYKQKSDHFFDLDYRNRYIIGSTLKFKANLSKNTSFRMLGTIAISLLYCVDFTFDGFFAPKANIWDIAGGIGILNSIKFPLYINLIDENQMKFFVAAHKYDFELIKLKNLII